MRKILISTVLAASALVATAPVAARVVPAPVVYANGHNDYGQYRSLQTRVDHLQREIRQLDRRNILSNREARSLMNDANAIEYRLHRSARNGLSFRERRDIDERLDRLQRRIAHEARDGDRYARNGRGDWHR